MENNTTTQSPWQPIDTAPKDGSLVLLLDESSCVSQEQVITAWFACNLWHFYDIYEDEYCLVGDTTFTPTHWVPIPQLPNSEV